VNLFFWLTIKFCPVGGSLVNIASGAFVLGAITMPFCCVMMAHFPKLHMIFAVPVLSLLAGGVLTLLEIAKL
jgi:hypothetical protein